MGLEILNLTHEDWDHVFLQENSTIVETPLICLVTPTAQTRTLVSQIRLLMVDQAIKLQMVLESLGK